MSQDTASEPQQDVVRVQEQLLEMLRSAGKDSPPPRRVAPEQAQATVAVAAAPATAPKSAPTKVSSAPPPAGTECPKCYSLTPWGKSNWCPECGYYPKAGFEGTGIVESEEEGPPPSLASVMPPWVAPTLVAALGIFISSIVTRFVFHDALQRSLVAITQLLVFTALALGSHFRASFIAIQTGRGWMSVVNPGETWALILNRMPATKALIVLLGCSLSGVASSFLIGPDVDLVAEEVAKEVKNNPKVTFSDIVGAMTKVTSKAFKGKGKNVAMAAFGNLMNATGGGGGGDIAMEGDLEGAIGSLAGTAEVMTGGAVDVGGDGGGSANGGGLEGAIGDLGGTAGIVTGESSGTGVSIPGTPGSSPKGPGEVSIRSPGEGGSKPEGEGEKPAASKSLETLDYWIYGFTTNPDGEIRSLLLASTGGAGRLKFAQKLSLDKLSSEELALMSSQLKPYRISASAVASSPYGGKWVKPVVKCRVQHEGLNDDSRPSNPTFQKVIFP